MGERRSVSQDWRAAKMMLIGNRRALLRQPLAPRDALNLLLRDGNTVADYRADTGVTGTLNASAWANQIGAAGPQSQVTAANQPIYLPWSGTNFLWLPNAAGNYASAPSSSALNPAGNFCIVFDGALDDWTVATRQVSKYNSGISGDYQYAFAIEAGGYPRVSIFATDADFTTLQADDVVGFSAASRGAVRVDVVPATASATFYTATTAGEPWTQLGSVITGTARVVRSSSTPLEIGSLNLGSAPTLLGKIFRVKFINGTFAGGTVGFDANFSALAEGTASFTESSSNAATVTINSTGAKPAYIVGSNIIACDGTDDNMAATFTASQPLTIYAVPFQPVWNSGKYLMDGVSANSLGIAKTTGTPKISLNAGAAACENAGLTLSSWHVLTAGLNGASSYTSIDGGAQVTGNPGAGNPGGLTIGADGAGANYGAVWYKEIIVRNVADSAATQARIQGLLKSIYNTP